ncbi:sensor histidine kinase [Pseudonocardia acaciae]|uniref:sensor histidine kinase n=1 Tax=Pseudonocardia acaciae TaxID=551276 RepID=UPI00049162F0|nr:HAMP domain-containing sensor histidine kinase [Pseudonocardia acaciae]
MRAVRSGVEISLRMRVALLAAVMVGLAAAGVSAAAFWVVKSALFSDLDDQLRQRAATVVASGVGDDPQNLPAAALYGSDIRVELVNPQGGGFAIRNSPPPPIGQPELAVAAGRLDNSLRTTHDMRVLAVPAGGGLALVLAQPMSPVRHTLAGLGVVLALVGGAGVVLAGLAGATVAGAGLRPVQRLTAATERVAATGDLRPIPVTGNDELARLTHSFNLMLGAVAGAQEQQRRLVADAGHELRTPLTSLRTNVELLIAAGSGSGAAALPEADRKEIFDDVRGQIEELSTLVGDLVELARDDAPQAVHEQVDLVEVVERALQRVRRRAGDVRFEAQLMPWTLPGDATALERAVLNLLDNAAKWSPPDGVVQVGLHPVGDGTAMLEVADAGPGIAKEDLAKVFDRFYRAAEDRGRPGSGLGLAIVKQVAERHGGSVRAGSSTSGGALLAVRLPGEAG